ncbi:MAG: NAD(P)-dependent oxidoreductase [Pseudomonadota bacterium]
MKKKILILGSNGFIGHNLVDYFSSKHNVEKHKVLSPKRQDLNLLDTAQVSAYMREHQPDVVIMSAVNINSLDENLIMYFNVERCSDYFGKMITIGSGAEYDMKNYKPQMSENYFGENIPSDTYGLSKFVVSNNIEHSNKNIINLRVFGIFGKYEDYSRRFISNNICNALLGNQVSLNKNMKFDFLYVNDFVRVVELFIENPSKHKNYNICTNKPIELLKIATIINALHGKNEKIIIKNSGINPEYSGDNSLFLSEFGDFKFTPFEESIAALYQWYKQQIKMDLNISDKLTVN